MLDDEIKAAADAAVGDKIADILAASQQGKSEQSPRQADGLKSEDVSRMIEDAIGRLRITGPGVAGSPKSGWVVNTAPVQLSATAVCNGDGTITITINY